MVQSTQKVGDQTSVEKPPVATFWHALFLGLGMKLGACTIGWNYGLSVGFWEFFIGFLGISAGYLMLCLCMTEMVSIMSFSGGYYGYARCAIGPLGGFLVGCSGAMESIFYLAMYVLKIGQFLTIVFDMDEHDQPVSWIVTYLILISFHVLLGRYFWNTSFVLGVGAFLLILIYLFGSMGDLDFEKWALYHNKGFSGDQGEFFTVFRLAVLFFLGFDMITLTSSEVKDSKKNIPRVMLSLITILFLLAIWIMFTVVSQYPGVSPELYQVSTFFPLVFGYQNIFGINEKQATVVAIIPIFVTALGYLHIVGRQIKSMATSGLLPSVFKTTIGAEETPLLAMILVACVALGGNYFAWREGVYTTTSRVATMAGCFVYLSMFYCFYVFRKRYGHLERGFHNPLGIASALLGFIVFGAVLFIIFIDKADIYYPITCWYFSYIAFMLIYYYAYAESHQCFSASEQKVFFKAYILNMHIRKKKAMHNRFASDLMSLIFASLRPTSSRKAGYSDNSSLGSADRSKTPKHTQQNSRTKSYSKNDRNKETNNSNAQSIESSISNQNEPIIIPIDEKIEDFETTRVDQDFYIINSQTSEIILNNEPMAANVNSISGTESFAMTTIMESKQEHDELINNN